LREARHIERTGKCSGAFRISIGTSDGKRLLGRPQNGWKDNIKMVLKEVGRRGVD
jgi:hypothetical protein